MALFTFGGKVMDAANRENQTTAGTAKPVFRLLTRDAQKPAMEPPPPPGDADEHPGDEPGYGHGV
jgi:hypothetical protein